MLRLLLDEHISPQVGEGLRRRQRSLVVHWMGEWESGSYLGQDDSACLLRAAAQQLTLVSYDLRTIPILLKDWAEQGRQHGGVIFVDEKSIPPADLGGLVRALSSLYQQAGKLNWTDRVCFLQR